MESSHFHSLDNISTVKGKVMVLHGQ